MAKSASWQGVVILLLILVGIYFLNVALPKFACHTNDECLSSLDRSGCILVDGFCEGVSCQVPACLNGNGVKYIRHVGSV